MKLKLPKPYNYELFAHMSDNHGLTLLDSEMDEIERTIKAARRNGKLGGRPKKGKV